MDLGISLCDTAKTLSPLAIIGLLIGVIYMVLAQRQQVQSHFDRLRENDLHELGEMTDTLRRIEVKLSEEFSFIRARLNGK